MAERYGRCRGIGVHTSLVHISRNAGMRHGWQVDALNCFKAVSRSPTLQSRCIAYTMALFDWDQNNLRKIRAHGIKRVEVEQALARDPILIYE
jgi:hypothetical protein